MSDLKIVDFKKRKEEQEGAKPTPEALLAAYGKLLADGGFKPDHLLIIGCAENDEGEAYAVAAMPTTTNKDVLWILQRMIAMLTQENPE